MRTYQRALLAFVLVAIVLWSFREHFEATQGIKAPPYDEVEKLRIYGMIPANQEATLLDLLKSQQGQSAQVDRYRALKTKSSRTPAEEAELRQLKLGFATDVTQVVGQFYTNVYSPATTPITAATVTTFLNGNGFPPDSPARPVFQSLLMSYFVEGVGTSITTGYADALAALGQGVGYRGSSGTRTSTTTTGAATATASGDDTVDPICETPGTTLVQNSCMATSATPPSCPSGYTLGTNTGGWRCERGTDTADPTCPPQTALGYDKAGNFGCIVHPRAFPSCPDGYTGPTDGKCRRSGTGGGSMSRPDTSTPGSNMTSTGGAMVGNTTGGSSTSVYGPTSGGRAGGPSLGSGGAGKYVVWGPVAKDRGEGGGVQPMDSTKTNRYPELLGGLGAGGDKTRVDGVGLTEPSSSWKLSMSGLLPDMKGLGADGLSQYLPFSRSPGDMEKIPDPYRVSQTFRTSSYTSKTEPVPFLADFSAFQ